MNFNKYKRGYFMPPEPCFDWVKKEYIDTAPTWCSVDLRDGNQSLIIPMSLDEKLKFFDLLVKVGFKEIEVGFPAASETEYQFLRTLIEQDLIPDDVTVQVLTQAREHIIKKTFDALDGCKKAVVHVYNSTSVAQREQVFRKSKEEILTIATNGAKLLKELAKDAKGDIRFEYSPESFTGTEMEYALEVCNAVLDIWQPTPDKKAIINLPVTVEMSMPHVYASQIEYMHKHLKHRDAVEISLHPHNDRGCGVADSELGLLAGADRIEGTLFGNGERTGNVDIVTLALNMFTHGVNPKLDFSNIQEIVRVYEEVTRMRVYDRQPYAGKLVFAAFSGSHQDAIAKGLKYREEIGSDLWNVPYLPIDPKDVGREYESDVIRINSQSGKGGIGYLMEEYYGFDLPKRFREGFGYYIKDISDKKHAELMPNEIKDIFEKDFVNLQAPLELIDYHFTRNGDISVEVEVNFKGEHKMCKGNGNGRLDAVANAFREHLGLTFDVIDYNEHSLGKSSASKACAYVEINDCVNVDRFGVGIHDDIIAASIQAMVSALNRAINEKAKIEGE
ncbi:MULTISPECIES: 2-isopropylmalate synthase [unclassified Breznakia]|uniref:2-isopropylmalate synthase n=1 Tax=unclassified Breznakia TaxID=2623764 RepID=UPI0024736145|nr:MULTISPECIES: 2-isopropylmalate synthase [unclassified Breznakia]MDH6366452.1 2-isopropylmalate synthase [Breznakia sp. PH1-1]MDH6403545.1 2-isopropylmalate synthase [Breznakia sp. PF1-11]MDH6411254.1 2-isopropylmalate synthase [Breznakia sp. PFB1-11]MDH6413483.1 2-isopropylmalate synthase [Breznakia sp. PFB1-14]MDH6415799.1 2-isopropylmalate synthase [Breznakia sp. PFB1-4]